VLRYASLLVFYGDEMTRPIKRGLPEVHKKSASDKWEALTNMLKYMLKLDPTYLSSAYSE
jgi:nitrate reductase assembly molybdenum cofactor insertion protein NarJ